MLNECMWYDTLNARFQIFESEGIDKDIPPVKLSRSKANMNVERRVTFKRETSIKLSLLGKFHRDHFDRYHRLFGIRLNSFYLLNNVITLNDLSENRVGTFRSAIEPI